MHRDAPLTVEGRRRLCRRIELDGFTVAQAAGSMNISRQTASKWWNRYRVAGVAGLEDRPCRPYSLT
ncbi:MAG: leucine zipper domain-containing protein [Acidimicrobiales bacterium]|jgi:transposase